MKLDYNYNKTFGDSIKVARKNAGITQKELAQRAGLAEITIRQYETNKREPRGETLRKIAMALDIPISDLTGAPLFHKISSMLENFQKEELMVPVEDNEPEIYELNEEHTISLVKQLNHSGLAKIDEYISDLLKIPEYRKNE